MSLCGSSVIPCGLAGAASFLDTIKDIAILINGPAWCYHYILQFLQDTAPQDEHLVYCTFASEYDVVYGAEHSLEQAAREIKKTKYKINAVAVINSCANSIIGDDVVGILKKQFDCEVLLVDGAGLKGDFCSGYRQAAKLVYSFLNLAKPSTVPKSVNLIGVCQNSYNCENDSVELIRMLNTAGIEVVNIYGGKNTTDSLKGIGKAALNVVVNPSYGLEIADNLKNDLSMPYIINPIPYGLRNSMNWLKIITSYFNDNNYQLDINNEYKKINNYFNYWRKKIIKNGGLINVEGTIIVGNYDFVCSLASFVSETVNTEKLYLGLRDYQEQYKKIVVSENIQLFDANNLEYLHQIIQKHNVELCFASSFEKFVFNYYKKNCIHINVCYPVYDEILLTDRPYAGFRGVLSLCEDIFAKYADFNLKRINK